MATPTNEQVLEKIIELYHLVEQLEDKVDKLQKQLTKVEKVLANVDSLPRKMK